MTVPAFSVSAVLPGAPIPASGKGAAATATGGGLFESLLAGFGEKATGAGPQTAKAGSANDPLETDLLPADATDQTQAAGLTMMMFAPASAPTVPVAPGAEGEAAADVTSARGRVSSFAHWASPAAARAAGSGISTAPSSTATPDLALAPATGGVLPTPEAMADLERPVKPAEVSTLPQTTPSDPKAVTAPSTRPVAPTGLTGQPPVVDLPAPAPAPEARTAGPIQPGFQPETQPSAAVATATPAAATAPLSTVAPAVTSTVAPTPTAVVEALAVADTPPPLRVAPPEGETRWTTNGRAERRADTAGRSVGAPSVDTSARQTAQAAVTATATSAIEADVDAVPVADLDLGEIPETRQPALPAEVRAQAIQIARTTNGRAERRADTASRSVGAPSVDTSARQAAQAAVTATATSAIEADVDAVPVADLDLGEIPETRQPALPAEVRAQATQIADLAAEAVATRSSAETVARLAADIVRKADGQSTRFDLQLDPHGLGKVDVALEIDRNGKLTAALSFDSAQSAADLRGRAGELRLALEQAGFDIAEGGLTFDLAGQGAGFGGREAGQQQDRAWNGRAFQRAQTGAEEADLSLASTPSTSSRWTRSGVDIRI